MDLFNLSADEARVLIKEVGSASEQEIPSITTPAFDNKVLGLGPGRRIDQHFQGVLIGSRNMAPRLVRNPARPNRL